MKPVVTFGEIMGRMAAPENIRLRQTRMMELTYAGAEASVAASICNFGGNARFVTALPKHGLAEAAVDCVRSVGIDTQFILRTDQGRLGLYFLETGANQRPSNVIYDRADSSVAITPASAYDWPSIFTGAQWLHLSGITPALSKKAAEATIEAAQQAKKLDCSVSIDLNFRGKLWKWDNDLSERELAQKTMRQILPYIDVVIANEEDCHDVLDIQAGETNVHKGAIDVKKYPDVARRLVDQFPSIQKVAITLRESHSASHNNWGAMLFDSQYDRSYFAPLNANQIYQAYEIKDIVDRVGGGDSFAGSYFRINNTRTI